ncbi:MAG: NAD-dependent epimerase/dehydratase family protein [Actinocrinis sp.]
MTRVFVSGGSGFVGGHLIETLHARGDQVVALARSDASAQRVSGFGAEPARVRIDDTAALAAVMSGCDLVVHAAAVAAFEGDRELFHATNVLGTQSMLDAARQAGVPRFVHVSSEQVLADGRAKHQVDESLPYPGRPFHIYAETKAEAERRVLSAAADGFATVAVRPRWVWGTRDHVLPQLTAAANAKALVWMSGSRVSTSTCHVTNLCHALLLAAERGRPGEAYFVGDDGDVGIREFVTALLETQRVPAPTMSVPFPLAMALSRLAGLLWKVLPGKPPLSPGDVIALGREFTVNTAKARADLGYEPVVSRAEGFAELARLTELAAAASTVS